MPADVQTRFDDAHARAPHYHATHGWQLVRLVGRGQWTEVYQARPGQCPDHWPSDYAVKLLQREHQGDPLARGLLRREAEVGKATSHPHLISVLAAHVDEPPFYLVLPFLPGAPLQQLLDRQKRSQAFPHLPVPQALWMTRQVAQALEALHDSGWLHGDVKPSNIHLDPHGHATLIDLGFARPLSELRKAAAQPLFGTLQYAAPELFAAAGRPDRPSDIYSLGATLYELLTGQLPFRCVEPADLAAAQLRHLPLHPRRLAPQLPPRLTRLLEAMLAKEPLRRPTASEIVSQLVQLEIETFAERIPA